MNESISAYMQISIQAMICAAAASDRRDTLDSIKSGFAARRSCASCSTRSASSGGSRFGVGTLIEVDSQRAGLNYVDVRGDLLLRQPLANVFGQFMFGYAGALHDSKLTVAT